ncbi:uncharacterized protein BX663DRAFT_499625 [Cokeromyces recurvatus]|uniref:uncharacterized protein n=1 Tax=Cokeromyces recurvatus TaxID=90255 RepID=UPI0022211184|nr:uncharacterized protein BX663DRAFT_499625 [Cokeromyces recurvatus]KAI7905410.1 hypothetical protein BX663DRAFT_499625 [Cokeromyces recurvatus]
MNLNELSSSNDNNDSTSIFKNELNAIYASTFQYVGMEFIDALLREITFQTKANSAIFIQLLSPEEYKEICNIYKKENKIHMLASFSSSSPSAHSSPETQHTVYHPLTDERPQLTVLQDKFLLIRSCFSTQTNIQSSFPNTIIPISSLNPFSPYIQVLLNNSNESITLLNQHSDTEKEEIDKEIYPNYEQFIGLKLVDNSTIRGILCVTTTNKENKIIPNLLKSVQIRCINELNQLRRQERLINARDLALLDAENKLKFLADMSHEIRTPMNAVIALTDLLLQERSSLNSEQIEHLEVIQTSGSHLLTIINDILDISKLNHDPKFKLESRRFSLRKCLKDTLNMARHQASMSQQNKVVYVLECPPDKDDNIPLPQLISQLENKGVLLRPLINKKGKTVLPIIWKIDSDVPDHLLGDTMRLTQILLNLCSNAVKFTKQGGIHIHIKRSTPTPLRTPSSHSRQPEKCMTFKERYEAKIETMWNQARERTGISPTSASGLPTNSMNITTSGSNDSTDNANIPDYFSEKSILEISVTDTGIGIPADRLPKLFKSFSQIDISTARRYGGTGLGLAISSTLVNRMGGCLWVESEEGVGSRFALTLPMTVAPKGRNYSTDSATTLSVGLAGSPSSPCSTVSDSSGSVHSVLGYFPLTGTNHSFINHQQRPILPRATTQQSFIATENATLQDNEPQIIENNTFSSIFKDSQASNLLNNNSTHPTDATTDNSNTEAYRSEDNIKRPISMNVGSSNTTLGPIAASNNRKTFNDLLLPATRNTRVGVTKQHYRNKPSQTKEENLAKINPLHILLAEDNILNQKIAVSILKRLGYIDVSIANNGKEVLTLMKTSVFDVIFMDLYMPEMDGLEVTREIIKERTRQQKQQIELATQNKNNSTTTTTTTTASNNVLLNAVDVYIIALTASASREDRQICIDAGMNDFISKPFTMTEMKSALKTCVNKRKKRRKLTQKEQPAKMEDIINDDDPSSSSAIVYRSPNINQDDPMLDVQSATTHLV